jgi:hypothetical protein
VLVALDLTMLRFGAQLMLNFYLQAAIVGGKERERERESEGKKQERGSMSQWLSPRGAAA